MQRSKEPSGILLHKSINDAISSYRYMMVDVHQSERCQPFFVHSVSEGVLILRRTENVRSASELVTGNTDPMVNKIRMQ